MESVGVVVATYGDFSTWARLVARAVASAAQQTVRPDEIVAYHGSSLAEARNQGALLTTTEWLIFLDADDELDSYYVEAMLEGVGDLRQPSTLGVVAGKEDDYPVLIPPHPGGFLVGNHLVIGSMLRAGQFAAVGGFRDLQALEDWDLWIRLRLGGAALSACPEAIYRVHVQPESRNQQQLFHGAVYAEIQQRYFSEARAKGIV